LKEDPIVMKAVSSLTKNQEGLYLLEPMPAKAVAADLNKLAGSPQHQASAEALLKVAYAIHQKKPGSPAVKTLLEMVGPNLPRAQAPAAPRHYGSDVGEFDAGEFD
jgi:hypothetical protein